MAPPKGKYEKNPPSMPLHNIKPYYLVYIHP